MNRKSNVVELERKTASVAESTGLLSADDTTGVVETIVSVTGVVDDVDDLIVPGAYAKSLAKRRPKGIHAHDWSKWTSKTLEIRELMPGDPGLAEHARRYKEKTGGEWPEGAGGLYVKTQYNLDTQDGRDGYSNVKFFDGEAEWSIGYQIPKGGAVRRKDGVRIIKELDLYEYSSVLFGANALTGTLSVKEAPTADDEDTDDGRGEDGEDEGEQQPAGDAEDELAALHQAADGELLEQDVEEGLERLETDPPAPHDNEDQDDDDGDGEGDDGGGDAGAGQEHKAGAPGVADTPGDAAAVARLKSWYLKGEGAAKIRWGQPGDFGRCVRIAGKHMPPEKAKGLCSNLHQAALGVRPGQEGNRRHGKSAGGGRMHLAGSLEELADSVKTAVTSLLAEAEPGPWPTIRPDESAPGWLVTVHGTYPDRVVASRLSKTGGVESFEIGYRVEDGVVELAEPEPVGLVLETEDDLNGGVLAGDLLDVSGAIEDAVRLAKALLHSPVEDKAGRVLSARNVSLVKTAVENLVSVLRAAGIEVGKPAEPEDQPDKMSDTDEQDTTAPSARTKSSQPETIELDAGEVSEGRTLLELFRSGEL